MDTNHDFNRKNIGTFLTGVALAVCFILATVILITALVGKSGSKQTLATLEESLATAQISDWFWESSEEKEAEVAAGVEYIDAKAYYEENGNNLKEIAAPDSGSIETEEEAFLNFTNRGFPADEVTASYDGDGQFTGEKEIAADSDSIHPMYELVYRSSGGEYWYISSVNGNIMAVPILFNWESNDGASVVLSENKKIVCYDGPTNSFYEMIPKKDFYRVIVVDTINAATLDSYTVEGTMNEND